MAYTLSYYSPIFVRSLTSLFHSSAVGFGALPSEPNLVDALAQSSDLITYIPSTYSTTWTKEDDADPVLGPLLRFCHPGWERAKEKRIGITAVYTGVFDIYLFGYG